MSDRVTRLNAALEGRYRVERELGEGGMATVYLADDLRHGRKVALKVLKPELAAVVGAERFLAEIKTTANLQHPHILPLFDSGEADSFLFYVMPNIEGESLRKRLDREHQLPVDGAVRIATAVASGLDYAHRHGVIHRDIKPANILLHDGEPVIADFGIALAVGAAGGHRLTETGLSLGTPHYMSPEQATGDMTVGPATDIYALGCVLFEMLVGQPPHTGSTAQAILGKIIAGEPESVTTQRKSVPVNVDAVVKKALEKIPADRFDSARAFVDALEDSRFRGLSGRDSGETEEPWRPSKPGQRLLIGVALLASALAVWGWLRPLPEEAPGQVLHLPLSFSETPRGRYYYSPGVELTRSGDRIAYLGVTGEWWLLDLLEDSSRPLGFVALGLGFSPSGDSLVYTSGGYLQQMYVVDLVTDRTTLLADSVTGQPAWNDDGWIYYTDISAIKRVKVSDGHKEDLDRPDAPSQWYARNPAPLPDGRSVLYTRVPLAPRNPAAAEVVALDLLSGEAHVLTNGVEARISPSGHLLVAQIDGALLASRFDVSSLARRGPLVKVFEGLEIRQSWAVGAAFDVTADGTLLYVKERPMPGDSVVFVGRDGRVRRIGPQWGGSVEQLAYRELDARWTAAVHRGAATPNVFVTADNGGEPRRLTFWEIVHYYPRFIPGSDDISFVAPRVGGKNWDLYRVPVDGGAAPALILDRPGDIRFPRFTEDGRWVVFCEVSHTGQRDVLAHRLDPDSATVLLAATDAQECDPDVSPDARWLAYTSDQSGRNEVWVRPFDQSLTTRWQVSTEGGSTPRWSSTGNELFYVSAEDEIIAVPVLDEVSFEWGPHQVLFVLDERSSWTGETSANDEQFILVRAQREASGQVMMVRNFFDLLRERVGG